MFGWDRSTRREDLQDGASQTMAVMGVEQRLGSWAEGGAATVRPLTAEPYLHGPDGFGTGSRNDMLVLMADGSVRTVSRDTDPTLLRRMAAIADGLPLDPAVPGEPGEQPSAPAPSQEAPRTPAVAQNPPDAPPISALNVSATGARIIRPDAGVALQQRLLSFRQEQPVARRDLLSTVEDLLGRKIVWNDAELGPSVARLNDRLTLELESCTVEELFRRLLDGTGLQFEIQADEIRLRPAPPNPSSEP